MKAAEPIVEQCVTKIGKSFPLVTQQFLFLNMYC